MKNFLALEALPATRRAFGPLFWVYFAAALLTCLGIQISGLNIGRWGVDARELSLAVETGGRLGAGSAADYLVAWLTPYLGVAPFPNLLPTAALVLVLCRMAYHRSFREQALIFYLSFPLIFQLQFVSKEMIVTLFAIFLFVAFLLIKNWKWRAIVAALALAVMAAEFRTYYAISMAIAACVFVSGRPRRFLVLFSAGMLTASLIENIRMTILINQYYIHSGVTRDAVSLLPLHFFGYGAVDFIGNYLLNLSYYLVPIVTNFRVQELYAQLYSIICVLLVWRALRHGERALTSVFLGILLTLPLFVAELGTLIRHVSAIMPVGLMALYFAPAASAGRAATRSVNALPGRRAMAGSPS
jgi:hypothetical protein